MNSHTSLVSVEAQQLAVKSEIGIQDPEGYIDLQIETTIDADPQTLAEILVKMDLEDVWYGKNLGDLITKKISHDKSTGIHRYKQIDMSAGGLTTDVQSRIVGNRVVAEGKHQRFGGRLFGYVIAYSFDLNPNGGTVLTANIKFTGAVKALRTLAAKSFLPTLEASYQRLQSDIKVVEEEYRRRYLNSRYNPTFES